ncbi:hypothetical protein [Streptomyces sp. NPDC050988]|uniref:hypothetical protein n=1 Tax=Streptomyces sp. NPDC050988 TaxID=3365637 RepID=UPI00379E96A4
MRIERPKRVVHRRRTTLRLLLPDRLDLEQSIPTMHTVITRMNDHEPQAGCLLPGHAPASSPITTTSSGRTHTNVAGSTVRRQMKDTHRIVVGARCGRLPPACHQGRVSYRVEFGMERRRVKCRR